MSFIRFHDFALPKGALAALASLSLLQAVSFSAPVSAQDIDPIIDGAKQCTRHLSRYEREYGIPVHLLSAIASTESGRWHEGLKIKLPWPWAVGSAGKGQYFATKAEAVAAVKKMRAQGIRNIDVGCMQVNLQHHPKAFSNIEEAFEPQTNIGYAAYFLRDIYNGEGSWKKAAAYYHSRTPSLAAKYVGKVYGSWYEIIDRVRSAQAQTASYTSPTSAQAAVYRAAERLNDFAPAAGESKMASKAAPERKAPQMRVIEISKKQERTRENGVFIIRPDTAAKAEPAVLKPSAKAPAVELRPAQVALVADAAAVNTHAVHSVTRQDGKKAGPRFIFDN